MKMIPTSIESEDVEERGSLSDRVLFWLLKHPYQRVSDLAFVFHAHPSTLGRNLLALRAQEYIDMIPEAIAAPTRPEELFYLTTSGIKRVASLLGGADAAHLARMWQANEAGLLRLLPQLHRALPLQDMVYRLLAEAPHRLAYPGGHPAALRWHWQRNYAHTFERKGVHQHCRVDAALVFHRRPLQPDDPQDESWHCFLFVMDIGLRGSGDLRVMRERLEQVLHWRESSERWGVYRAFPPLLILAPSMHQRDLWLHCAQEAATHLRVAPLLGACALSFESSPWQFSWQALDGSGTTSLLPLAQPMRSHALPPGLLAPKPMQERSAKRQGERQIVVGRFEARAKRRETLDTTPKSSHDALLSLHLCYRHIDVLKELYAVPLIAAHELAALLQRKEDTLRRYLYDLRDLGCLEAMATRRGKRLLLTERGLRLLAGVLGVSFLHIAERAPSTGHWQQRGIKQTVRTIEHTAGIYDFLARLQMNAAKRRQELLWWETTRSFRRYRFQGAWHNLMPDALLEYRNGETRVEAWLEWDTGSMHHRPMTTKFEAYAHYIRSRQYRQEHHDAPILLLVAPQHGRERSLRRLATSVLGTLPLTVWTTTEQLLQVQAPQSAIWWKRGREQDEDEEIHRTTWVI